MVIQMNQLYFLFVFGLHVCFLAHSSSKPLEYPDWKDNSSVFYQC